MQFLKIFALNFFLDPACSHVFFQFHGQSAFLIRRKTKRRAEKGNVFGVFLRSEISAKKCEKGFTLHRSRQKWADSVANCLIFAHFLRPTSAHFCSFFSVCDRFIAAVTTIALICLFLARFLNRNTFFIHIFFFY